MTRRNQEAFERWAPTYDVDPNPHAALEYEAVLEAVSPTEADEILDAACGTGRYAKAFRAVGAEVVGVDFSNAMLTVARQKVPEVDFVEADIAKPLPFSDARFTKINCAQALKHLKNLEPVMAEFARLLKPGGLFVFSVTHPDMDWTGYELDFEPGFILSLESDVFHHELPYYQTVLADAGLALIDVVALCVSEKIAHLLTNRSFQTVRGRPQIAVFRARKSARAA